MFSTIRLKNAHGSFSVKNSDHSKITTAIKCELWRPSKNFPVLGIPDILILRLKIAQISLCIGLSAINSVLSPQLIVFKLVLVVFIVAVAFYRRSSIVNACCFFFHKIHHPKPALILQWTLIPSLDGNSSLKKWYTPVPDQ